MRCSILHVVSFVNFICNPFECTGPIHTGFHKRTALTFPAWHLIIIASRLAKAFVWMKLYCINLDLSIMTNNGHEYTLFKIRLKRINIMKYKLFLIIIINWHVCNEWPISLQRIYHINLKIKLAQLNTK